MNTHQQKIWETNWRPGMPLPQRPLGQDESSWVQAQVGGHAMMSAQQSGGDPIAMRSLTQQVTPITPKNPPTIIGGHKMHNLTLIVHLCFGEFERVFGQSILDIMGEVDAGVEVADLEKSTLKGKKTVKTARIKQDGNGSMIIGMCRLAFVFAQPHEAFKNLQNDDIKAFDLAAVSLAGDWGEDEIYQLSTHIQNLKK
jgi:hypothetical protein